MKRTSIKPRRLQNGIGAIVGLGLTTFFAFYCLRATDSHLPIMRHASVLAIGTPGNAEPFEAVLRDDPLAAMIRARAEHRRQVADYECVMVKQELLPSGMSEEQEIAVKFRREPYSVYMNWLRNPGMATRVIYVRGKWTNPRAKNPDERELAVAQPGVIARIFIKSVKRPIHGKLARASSRRFIDDFGFERTYDRLIQVCEMGRAKGQLSLEFMGTTIFDGRPVWVIRRVLPYTGEDGQYPDRTAEILIDQEYHVPVAIYCYADDEMKSVNVLAKYEYRGIRMQIGLTDKDFDPATYGM